MSMAELLGFRDANAQDAATPANPRYWKNIIPDYYQKILNLEGSNHLSPLR